MGARLISFHWVAFDAIAGLDGAASAEGWSVGVEFAANDRRGPAQTATISRGRERPRRSNRATPLLIGSCPSHRANSCGIPSGRGHQTFLAGSSAGWRGSSRNPTRASELARGAGRSGQACPISSRATSGSRTAILPQQTGADEGEECQRREHRPYVVPEVPRPLECVPRLGEDRSRGVGAHGS